MGSVSDLQPPRGAREHGPELSSLCARMSPRHRKPIPEPDHDTAAALHTVAPVPTTSIFSESDGVVAWQCSINPARHAHTENIEAQGARGWFFRVAHPPEVVTQRN